MGTRTVRLDEDAEKTLARLRKLTGLTISEVLKRGLSTYEQQSLGQKVVAPFEIYRRMDLGKGGWSIAPAADAKRGVREALRRKLGR